MTADTQYADHNPVKGDMCMKGGIYTDQRCIVCGGIMRDTGRDVSCAIHHVKADKFKVKFGKVIKRFGSYPAATRFLTGVRYETDRRTFDERDYKKDNPLSFRNASERYKAHRKPSIKPNSYRSMSNHFDKAQAYFQNRSVKDLNYADFEDFLKSLPQSDKTKKNVQTSIIAMYGWLKKRQEVHLLPEFPEVEFELGYRKTIDKDAQQSILDDIKAHEPFKVWLGIRFLATYISLRPMELMNVTWGNFDAKNGYIYIPHPKEKKPKAVPMLPDDVFLLGNLPKSVPSMFIFGDSKRFGVNRFYKAWKRACARLGIEGVDLYGGTRHSSARALRKHFSPEQIKSATMHSTNKAFERYFCMDSEDVRSIYRQSAQVIDLKMLKDGESDTRLTPEIASFSGGKK